MTSRSTTTSQTTTQTTDRSGRTAGTATRIAAGAAAVAGMATAAFVGAGAAQAQPAPSDPSAALGSITSGSVGLAGAVGAGSATGSLPGQCSAIDPLFGSLGVGMWSHTTAEPGDQAGHTAFLVDQNLPSEGSSTTEDPVIQWKNEDTGASGTVTQGPQAGHIYWFEHQGVQRWGADIETGAGTITWTMSAHEQGVFPPALSVQGLLPGLLPPIEFPYNGCGGQVVVP